MKIYYYLYFRLYKFARKVGTVDATWTAMLVISALLFLNIATLFLLFFKQDDFFVNPRILGGVTIILVGLINYFIFIRHDNCFQILHQFEGENKKQKNKSVFFVFIYILLTIFLSHLYI
jgi:hypothetical protein